ncbi:MAG: hypothetical protein AB1546_02905, partial [bacterium]
MAPPNEFGGGTRGQARTGERALHLGLRAVQGSRFRVRVVIVIQINTRGRLGAHGGAFFWAHAVRPYIWEGGECSEEACTCASVGMTSALPRC